jgi:hypothetical protein
MKFGGFVSSALLVALGMAVPVLAPSLDPARGAKPCVQDTAEFARTELYLGLARPDGGLVTDEEFARFVAEHVRPNLPDGFTVVPGEGYFRTTQGLAVSEPSRVLVVFVPRADLDAHRRLERVRTAYRTLFLQESVLRVDDVSCVSF